MKKKHIAIVLLFVPLFISISCSEDGHGTSVDSGVDAGQDGGDSDGGSGSGVAPRLIAPLSTSMVSSLRPTMKWTGGAGDHFVLELSKSKDFSTVDHTWQGSENEHTPTVDLEPTVYFWRVRVPDNPPEAQHSATWEVFIGRQEYDVNGDGYSDILLGTLQSDYYYLFYGSADIGGEVDVEDADVVIDHGAGGMGNNCSIFSDMTGDDLADIVFGQPLGKGGIRICEGGDLPSTVSYESCYNITDDTDIEQDDAYGGRHQNNGDMDGDGAFDFTVTAQLTDNDAGDVDVGLVYLYLSDNNSISDIVERDEYSFVFSGTEAFDAIFPNDMIADFNGNGLSELLISTGSSGGENWMIFGGDEFAYTIGKDDADIVFSIENEEEAWFRGSNLYDINSDGYGDLALVYGNDSEYWIDLFLGNTEMASQLYHTDANIRILFPMEPHFYDWDIVVFGLQDVNGDMYDDFGVSMLGAVASGWDPIGGVYIFYGGPDMAPEMTVDDADVFIQGNGDPWFALTGSGVGDINNDGFDDFAVSATGDEFGGADTFPGRVFVFFGGPTLADKVTADDADLIISSSTPDEVLGMCINRGGV